MHISKNFIISFLAFVFFAFDFFLTKNIFTANFIVVSTFIAVGLISFISIVRSRKPISIFNMVHIFILLFFYFTGLKQYCDNVVIWNYMHIQNFGEQDYIIANVVIAIFQLLFNFIYYFYNKKDIVLSKNKNIEVTLNTCILFTVLNLLLLVFLVRYYGFAGLFDKTEKIIVDVSQTENMVIDNFLRVIPSVSLLLLIIIPHKSSFVYKFCLIINFIIVFVLFFPFGAVSRYRVAFVYISLLISLFRNKIKTSSVLLVFMIVAILVIFPFMNFFRYNSLSDLDKFELMVFDYSSGDFDTYQMLISSIKYANSNGILYGKNLITAILFFVPRSVWGNKMSGSGYYIAEFYNASFKNISCPFIAECYLAFGIFGVLFFAIVFGRVIKKLDLHLTNGNSIYSVISVIVFGFIIFIMRGDLLSSYAYLVGSIIPCIMLYLVIRFNYQMKYKIIISNSFSTNTIKHR